MTLPTAKRQVLILLVLAILGSIAMIVHGVFFDLDASQIKRLTVSGLFVTILVVFPAILFLEWVFDINNRERTSKIESRIKKLEKKGIMFDTLIPWIIGLVVLVLSIIIFMVLSGKGQGALEFLKTIFRFSR